MPPLLGVAAAAIAREFLPSLLERVISEEHQPMARRVLDVAAEVAGVSVEQLHDDERRRAAIEALRADPERAIEMELRLAELAAQSEAARLAAAVEEMRDAGMTYRAEIASEDPFVRRARPFGVWISHVTTALFVLLIPVTAWIDPEACERLLESLPMIVPLLGAMQGGAAYYTRKRSEDKRAAAQMSRSGEFDALPF